MAAVAGGLFGLWLGYGVYERLTTERVPYETVETFDGVERRRYPGAVLVETTAADEGTAFRRLARYLGGANEAGVEVPMTAPVATREGDVDGVVGGVEVPMTAPVRSREVEDGVTMSFYLPASLDRSSAPLPTEPAVRLVVEPPRTLAVRAFSWLATDRRVTRERERLLATLAARGVDPAGEPFLLRYNSPWTPPFLRTNEVAVDVRGADAEGDAE
jgi:hypothetical protein